MTPRPSRLLVLLASAALQPACSSSEPGSPATPAPFDAADADPSDGDATAADALDDTSAEAPDAADDAQTTTPFAHCSLAGAVPAGTHWDPSSSIAGASCAHVEVRLEPWDSGALRVRYDAPGSPSQARPWAIPSPPLPDSNVFAGTTPQGWLEVCTQWLSARVDPSSCRVQIEDADGTVLLDDGPSGGWSTQEQILDGQPVTTIRVQRQTPPDELFYGFGEKTGPLEKRGQRMVFWNTDAYDSTYGGYAPGTDPLYASIPFFIGLRGTTAYGLLTDNSHRLEMDMAGASAEAYTIEAFGGAADQVLLPGPHMREVIQRMTEHTGRLPMQPRWALGYHQCRWGYSPASAFEAVGQEFRNRGIPADGLWLDIQHMDGFRTFTWDPASFPDPAAMMGRLADAGFKVTVIADPGIKQDPGWPVYDTGLAGGHFLMQSGGTPYVGVVWPGPSVFPDFSSPDARAWWGDGVGQLVQAGVRGVWLDVNEPTVFPESGGGSVPNDLVIDGDGVPGTMAELHNAYALHEAMATREGMLAAAPERRPFLLTRAGYVGIQRYAAMWTGDAPSTWTSLQQTLPMLLNLGLSGVPFVGSDVGGYSGGASPELFARWMAVGSVSPFFRGHVTNGVNAQEPWAFGLEVEDISRALINDRYALLPYLYTLFREASQTGMPVLRPMVLEFQDDPVAARIEDQAMLGPWLLIAPVLEESADQRSVYLPAGRWIEVHSGAAWDGPATITVSATLAALPTFLREGAIVPRFAPQLHTDEYIPDTLFLQLVPSLAPTEFSLYEDDGDGYSFETQDRYSLVTYRLERLADGARLAVHAREGTWVPASRTLVARVHRVDHGVSSVQRDGAPLPQRSSFEELIAGGEGWWYDDRDLSAVVAIPDQDDTELRWVYDTAMDDLRPPVAVEVEVTLPDGTPASTAIHITSSANAWAQQPLDWGPGANQAHGTLVVPRGEWFFYKYTRGDWDTVEKWPGCEEATNRYGFGAAHPERTDVVALWRDWCP